MNPVRGNIAATIQRQLSVHAGPVVLTADLSLPEGAPGVVVFAHGSGSNRRSPRNRLTASVLHEAGVATLLVDLLTEDEQRRDAVTRDPRFDVTMLGARLVAALDALGAVAEAADLPVGCYGASTGAAAAIEAAAARPDRVRAVVSRGGRPDLASDEGLAGLRAPTLLIVGGDDRAVLGMNRGAMERTTAPVRLEVVPGASHLFEEPGALERAAALARGWFALHLVRPPSP